MALRCRSEVFRWVRTGILRALSEPCHLLSKALGNRVAPLAAGLGLTTCCSDPADDAILTPQGLVELGPLLAILLGANVDRDRPATFVQQRHRDTCYRDTTTAAAWQLRASLHAQTKFFHP